MDSLGSLSNTLWRCILLVFTGSHIHSDMFVSGTCLNYGWTQDAALIWLKSARTVAEISIEPF